MFGKVARILLLAGSALALTACEASKDDAAQQAEAQRAADSEAAARAAAEQEAAARARAHEAELAAFYGESGDYGDEDAGLDDAPPADGGNANDDTGPVTGPPPVITEGPAPAN